MQIFNKKNKSNAIIEINPGAGGVESQDWAKILMRMYIMWAKKKKYKIKQINLQKGEAFGIKSATLEISGYNSFNYIESEIGIHRLIRISPFNSDKKRHTSFTSIYVYPIINNNVDININDSEIIWQTFKSKGAGGQNVNKIETAVRLKHINSGMIVECQQERSQIKNKNIAINILKSKLHKIKIKKNKKKEKQKNINFGSQIRSYVLHPYKLIKDHRTNLEIKDINNILNGELCFLIKSYLVYKNKTSGVKDGT